MFGRGNFAGLIQAEPHKFCHNITAQQRVANTLTNVNNVAMRLLLQLTEHSSHKPLPKTMALMERRRHNTSSQKFHAINGSFFWTFRVWLFGQTGLNFLYEGSISLLLINTPTFIHDRQSNVIIRSRRMSATHVSNLCVQPYTKLSKYYFITYGTDEFCSPIFWFLSMTLTKFLFITQ